jgi:hypothetical protein
MIRKNSLLALAMTLLCIGGATLAGCSGEPSTAADNETMKNANKPYSSPPPPAPGEPQRKPMAPPPP